MIDETVATSDPQKVVGDIFAPQLITDFVGQDSIRLRISLEIQACYAEGRMPLHTLATGPSGLGKTILAEVIARTIHCIVVKNVGGEFDTDKRAREIMHRARQMHRQPFVWLIDEIDAMRYGAATAFHNLMTSSLGNNGTGYFIEDGREVWMPPLTLYGTTNFKANLPRALKSRFAVQLNFQYYTVKELTIIAQANAQRLGLTVTPEAARFLAENAGGEPRKVIHLIRTAKLLGMEITEKTVAETMEMIEYFPAGLDKTQVEILRFLSRQPKGTAGVDTIAGYLGEDTINIKGESERYLLRCGLIAVTRGGRQILEAGKKYLETIGG